MTRQWGTPLAGEATLFAMNVVLAAMVPLWSDDTGTATGAQNLVTWAQTVTPLNSFGEFEESADVTILVINDRVSANDSVSPQS